jgi:hypothetical protein
MLAGVVGAVGSGDAHRNEAELEGGSVVADSVGGQFVHGEGEDLGDVPLVLFTMFEASEIAVTERNLRANPESSVAKAEARPKPPKDRSRTVICV